MSLWKCKLKCRLLKTVDCSIGNNIIINGLIEFTGFVNIGNNTFIGKCLKVNENGSVYIGDKSDLIPEIAF